MAQRRGLSPTPDPAPDAGAPALGAGEPEPLWTSGRECWVFRADRPDQLCGYHPRLIASALAPDESLRYLLYSPIFDASDGPFAVGGRPGSHAVAITPQHLLMSRDPHSDTEPRSVSSIDLPTVSALEIGCALALGWFVVRFGGPQAGGSRTVLFGNIGARHFREIVNIYRRSLSAPADLPAGIRWPSVWTGVPPYLQSELEPLIEPDERPLAVLRSPERWARRKRLFRHEPVCVAPAGLLLVTSLGVLWAVSEPRLTPDLVSFGVNVTVARWDRLLDAGIGSRVLHETTLGLLRFRVGARCQPLELEVPFDARDIHAAEDIVQLVAAWRGRP